MLTSLFYRKVMSKSLPDIKILFLRLRNFEKQIRSNKKRKAPCHKAFLIRQTPLFDKTVRKAGFIQFGAGDRTRTGTLSPAVDFESTTSTNSITPADITRTLYRKWPAFRRISRGNFAPCPILHRRKCKTGTTQGERNVV